MSDKDKDLRLFDDFVKTLRQCRGISKGKRTNLIKRLAERLKITQLDIWISEHFYYYE